MIHSMTGYASAARDLPQLSLAAELKSVNGRYLDIQFRLPDELRSLEPPLREMIAGRVGRGKVECRVAVSAAAGAGPQLALNDRLLSALAAVSRKVREAIPDAAPLRVGEVLHWPGVLADDRSALVRDTALALLEDLLKEFSASRAREGEKLAGMVLDRVERMEALLARIQPLLPEAVAAYEDRLAGRLREALGASDEERIRQEIALFGVKIDVAEELSRLAAHLQEVRRVVTAGGVVGKRLDFLMQELNREANTLASKSVSKELSDASLEFKLLIEQMREQIQNIE
jgi:uncharacterized protein (TIGR00255 family)